MDKLELDPDLVATLTTLERHRVEFVLTGDIARAIYGHGGFVSAIAVVPAGYGRNVERLMHALAEMNADLGIAGRPDSRGLDWRRSDLREIAPCTFMTDYADVDLDFEPAGTNGYRDLFQDADRFDLAPGARPYVVAIEDLERVTPGGASAPPVTPIAAAAFAPPPASPVGAPPAAVLAPDAADDYDPGVWTADEFRAIRAGRAPF